MGKASSERQYYVIKSGSAVWTRCDIWSVDGTPYLIRDEMNEAIYERERAEAYREEEYPELTEPARIVAVTITERQ